MKKLPILLLSGCLLAIVSGCGSSAPSGYTGTFNSPQAGMMELTQQGNKVTGSYDAPLGYIDGTVEGRRLTFKWWQAAEPNGTYEQAPRKGRGDGYFELDANSSGFEGQYRLEGDTKWRDEWYGVRVVR